MGRARGTFPDLLAPTLRRCAAQSDAAVRAVILRHLPWLQHHAANLGWEVFDLAMSDNDERLWKYAEPCLYYAYHRDFARVAPYLERIAQGLSGDALETWGRIRALASLSGHVDPVEHLSRLRALGRTEAWQGSAMVWANNAKMVIYRGQCFDGLRAGVKHAPDPAAISRKMHTMFRHEDNVVPVPAGPPGSMVRCDGARAWQATVPPSQL